MCGVSSSLGPGARGLQSGPGVFRNDNFFLASNDSKKMKQGADRKKIMPLQIYR